MLFSGAVQSRALICIKDAKEKSEGSHCSPPPWHHYLVSLACVCVCVHARGHTQIACWGLGRSLRVLTKRGTALCGTVSLPGTPGRGRASLFFWPCAVDKRRGGRGGGKGGEGGAKAKKGPTCFQKERGQQLEQLEQQRKINVRKEKSYIRPAPITLPGGLCAFHREGRESLHVSQQKATKCVHIVRFFFFFHFLLFEPQDDGLLWVSRAFWWRIA